MTKTIVIGDSLPKTELKPIEFHKVLLGEAEIEIVDVEVPKDYKFIELICHEYGVDDGGKSFDLIFAYNNPQKRSEGVLYLGSWNDGVVE